MAELRLAEPQRFVIEEFAAVGLDFRVVGETLLDEMTNRESDHRVEAARLMLDVTIGRAPTNVNSKNLHVSLKSDKFFDLDTFATTPKPKVD